MNFFVSIFLCVAFWGLPHHSLQAFNIFSSITNYFFPDFTVSKPIKGVVELADEKTSVVYNGTTSPVTLQISYYGVYPSQLKVDPDKKINPLQLTIPSGHFIKVTRKKPPKNEKSFHIGKVILVKGKEEKVLYKASRFRSPNPVGYHKSSDQKNRRKETKGILSIKLTRDDVNRREVLSCHQSFALLNIAGTEAGSEKFHNSTGCP